jgi:hypothetical protein
MSWVLGCYSNWVQLATQTLWNWKMWSMGGSPPADGGALHLQRATSSLGRLLGHT